MNLRTVTITGADDSTDIGQMVDLSGEFPYLEWGILVSKKQEGSYRFPSRKWCDELSGKMGQLPFEMRPRLSMHVCGLWTRQMLTGELAWSDLPSSLEYSGRIQVNTHAEPHVSTVKMIGRLLEMQENNNYKEFIFQWDGLNDHLTRTAIAHGVRSSALFDLSGGAGILPDAWPKQQQGIYCGYAGGLGPDNIKDQLYRIEYLCKNPYWIDMERRVRTEDDSALDMSAVRSVLESARSFWYVTPF